MKGGSRKNRNSEWLPILPELQASMKGGSRKNRNSWMILQPMPVVVASMKGGSRKNRNPVAVWAGGLCGCLNEGRFPKEPQSLPDCEELFL